MKHKVKVTVIDKKSIQNCSKSIVQTPKQECVHATTLVMNSFLSATKRTTTSGMEG